MDTRTPTRYIDRPDDVAFAARALADGAVVAVAFANFYALVARPEAECVRRLNRAKGRSADQVGSITVAAYRIPSMFDWSRISPRLPERRVRALMEILYGAGPFGFRGPAADRLPDHLTQHDRGVRTTQVIAPGVLCPSNAFIERAASEAGVDHLAITSANRSRHLTGVDEEPAHWKADRLAADFAHLPDLVLLAHRDEAAARAVYAVYLPTSVTLLSFHQPEGEREEPPVLIVDRHGSLHVDAVRRAAAPLGLQVRLAADVGQRLRVRAYDDALV
ncbi:L-threonylcarbamoyladenylate synthase [Micromonospora avicenniae]|uniref:tRNA A37 threonylcarbamoyladenosine synthetase subunit TsaC/SUA5/YrdC n=1 Tax=Micromonospora avicenniae TaxID=1198245 RepID=A0A1N7D6T2_9ACTN|nr:Sua5/YciO/YrdC/YwlC family protein [Micromonospora avicenniae]SIR71586.1 tRNA A37 threonylcarbamoyladenosine synthetase subunit TsaC/SUA5/YrdC [Micromonospora avicenniae]